LCATGELQQRIVSSRGAGSSMESEEPSGDVKLLRL
jgi:hypothetical protein